MISKIWSIPKVLKREESSTALSLLLVGQLSFGFVPTSCHCDSYVISIWDVILMSRTVTELSTFIMCHTGEICPSHRRTDSGKTDTVCATLPFVWVRVWMPLWQLFDGGNFPLKIFPQRFLLLLLRHCYIRRWWWWWWCKKLKAFSAAIYCFSWGTFVSLSAIVKSLHVLRAYRRAKIMFMTLCCH